MGFLANYMRIDDATLDALTKLDSDDLVERIEELDEAGAPVYDMDKMWDILHFVLTGKSASEPIDGDPLSEAVVGVHVFDGDDFVAAIQADELPRILQAMDDLDFVALRPRLSLATLRKKNIYPSLAETTAEEEDALWTQITGEFEGLRSFYHDTVAEHLNVIVSIY